jgi:5-methylcytosine-specific restriction endonuclease McrA
MKKYGLVSNFESIRFREIKKYGKTRLCPRCKNECDINDFYKRRGKENSSVYCKKCTNLQTIERQHILKQDMVNYKGGKCENCGYDKYLGALEFHHMNPKEKDFNLSQLKSYKFDQVIKNELDKCILLCANCHREIHQKDR